MRTSPSFAFSINLHWIAVADDDIPLPHSKLLTASSNRFKHGSMLGCSRLGGNAHVRRPWRRPTSRLRKHDELLRPRHPRLLKDPRLELPVAVPAIIETSSLVTSADAPHFGATRRRRRRIPMPRMKSSHVYADTMRVSTTWSKQLRRLRAGP